MNLVFLTRWSSHAPRTPRWQGMHGSNHPLVARLAAAAFLVCASAYGGAVDKSLIEEGDAHERKLETKEALACYLEVEKAEPDNPELLVKIARQYRHLLADASRESDKVKLGNTALAYSKRAVSIAPDNSDAQLSCAISYGKLLPYMPKRDQVSSSKLIKTGAERAIKLDPGNDLAWHVLGRWHLVAADMSVVKRALAAMAYESLPPASTEEAVRCLSKAAELNPRRLMHFIELGKAYAQAGHPEEARRYLEKGLSMPSREKEDFSLKKSGREALASLN
jgi:tetratricopeptide (TPR) repeat protein